MKESKLLFLGTMILFVLGFSLCLYPLYKPYNESFKTQELPEDDDEPTKEGMTDPSCPTMLVRSGNRLFLQNPNMPKSRDNPKMLRNLEEYSDYVKEMQSKGKRCPILFLQEETDTQGNNVYRARENATQLYRGTPMRHGMNVSHNRNTSALFDSSRKNPPYNNNQYAGFDAHGQHVGEYTKLDAVHSSTRNNSVSDNPMDTNWGGIEHSTKSIQGGKYDDRIVGKPTMVPKVIEKYK